MKVDRNNEQFKLIEKALQADVLSVGENIPQSVYKSADNNRKKHLLKGAYEKALRKVNAKLDSNFRCFNADHSDHSPSMRWSADRKAFHCFGCMEPGINYDLFDAISEVYQLGEQSYSKAYKIAVKLFVTGTSDTVSSDFTKEMKQVMRYQCHTPIAEDDLGLAYLAKRRISKEVATSYGVQTWEFQGARYIVMINDNGSLVRRLIAVNHSIAGMYSSEPMKWFNQKGKSGFFNYRAINNARNSQGILFLFEGAIDCLTLIECIGSAEGGSYATALNSIQNLPKFLVENNFPYIIGFMDNDETGQKAAELLKEKGYFVVDYANYEHLQQFKDFNEAWVANQELTKTEIAQIIAKAKEFYKLQEDK